MSAIDKILKQWSNSQININVPFDLCFEVAGFSGTPDSLRYNMGTLECRICGERHTASWPDEIHDPTNQECPNCNHLASEPVSDCYREIKVIDGKCIIGDYWYA